MATLTVRSLAGTVLAEYPDFESGTRLRVLPTIVSSQVPIGTTIVDDTWSFAGPTRHPEYAHIRHDRDTITVAIERHRLQPRPQ